MAKVVGWFVVVAIFALGASVFAACNDDDEPDAAPTTAAVSPQPSTPDPTSGPTAAPTLSAEISALSAGLPSASELGEGREEEGRGPTLPTDTTLCGEPADFTSEVIGAYTKASSQHLSAIVGISRGTGAIEELRAGLEGCGELTTTSAGRTVVYQVEVVEFPVSGDDTLAIRATTQLEGSPVPSESYFVIVEDGDLTLAVVDSFLATADPAEVESVVIAAHQALQRIS
jgi:hypothetical protein